jgi:hypothetical protein
MGHALGYRRLLCRLSRSRERHRDTARTVQVFEKLGGKGKVVYIEGILGNPGEAERGHGFNLSLKDYPASSSWPAGLAVGAVRRRRR